MKVSSIAAMACVALLAGCAPEWSGKTMPVKSGTPTVVGFISLMTKACQDWAPPEASVATPPHSGTVSFLVERRNFNNPTSNCNGTPMSGRSVVYTPSKGFKGADQFVVRYVYDSNDSGGHASRTIEYRVNVR